MTGGEDSGGGTGQGRELVRLRLEGPIPAAIASLAESDLRTAFGRRGVGLTRREGATAAAPEGAPGIGAAAARPPATGREMVLTVGAATERLDQIVLTLEGAGASTLTRRLNLTRVPADGRVLALVVAADEMLVASADERLVRKRAAADAAAPPSSGPATAPVAASAPAAEPAREAAASPNPSAPAKPPTEPPAAAPRATVAATAGTAAAPRARPGSRAAATFAFDHFGGGQTLLGFDLGWTRRVGSRVHGLLAAQGRQGLTASASTGTVGSRLLGVRLAAGMALIDGGGPLWLGFDVGARAGRLWLDGRTQDTQVRGLEPISYLVYADAMLTLDVRLGRSPLALRLAIGGGLPLLAQVAAERNPGVTAVTGASGAAFESQGGIVLSL